MLMYIYTYIQSKDDLGVERKEEYMYIYLYTCIHIYIYTNVLCSKGTEIVR
jgi:hypothetical protein